MRNPQSLCAAAVAACLASPLFAQQFENGAPPLATANGVFLPPGDLDGDGAPDLIAVIGGQLVRYDNDGFGRFARPTTIATFASSEFGAVADFDGDGDGDLVAWSASINFSTVDLHVLNNGGATFANTQLLQSGLQIPLFALPIDFDNDGDLDIVAAASGGVLHQMFALENNGAGQFTDVSASVLPPNNPLFLRRAAVIDVDGDGRDDILTIGYTPNGGGGVAGLGVLRNTGATFVDQSNLLLPVQTNPAPTESATIGDLDGDGDSDVFAIDTNGGVRLFENQAGTFVDATPSLPPTPLLRSAVFFDVDDDQIDDLYVRLQSNEGRLLRNNGGFLQTPAPAPAFAVASNISAPAPVTAVDLDRDGDRDLISWRVSTDALRNDSDGGLTAFWPDLNLSVGSIAGDVDNDGDLDIATSQGIAFNNGFGEFTLVPGIGQTGGDLGDIDGDGDLDLVRSQVFTNNGSGTFNQAAAGGYPPAGIHIVRQVRLADFDGDGDLDLATLGLLFPVQVRIYANTGAGQFFPVTTLNTGTVPQTMEIGDADGDQDLDIVLGGADVRILENVGGTISLGPVIAAAGRARFADLQGNGTQDLVLDSALGQTVRILRRQANTWVDVTNTVIPGGTSESSVAIGDLDNDGDVDLAGAGVLRNDLGVLTQEAATLRDDLRAAYLADFDGDGDPELVADDYVHRNREHLVALPRPGVIGLDLRIETWALPGRAGPTEFAFVGVGTSRVQPGVALPPWGNVRIGGFLGLLQVPIAAGAGVGELDLTIPAVPTLVGSELAFQCLHLGPTAQLLGAPVRTILGN